MTYEFFVEKWLDLRGSKPRPLSYAEAAELLENFHKFTVAANNAGIEDFCQITTKGGNAL